MQRRGESGQPTKGQRKIGPKARKAPIASVSAVDLEEQLDRRTRELDEALQQQTATSEVLSIIRRSPADPQPVFDAIVQSAARLCGAVFSVVYLCDGDHLRIAATKNFTPEATSQIYGRPELKRPDRSHTGGRAILDRAVVHIHDVLEDPEYSREFALAGGWRAVLGVPLLRDGQSVGAITVGKREPTPFSEQQIQLLKTFADQAVIAIENVRLFEAEQTRTRELSEALEQQTATSEVLKVISSSPGELEPVFEAMLANAMRVCEAKFGFMYRCSGDNWEIQAQYGAVPAYADIARRSTRPGPQTVIGRIASTRQMVQVADLAASRGYAERDPLVVAAVEIGGVRSILGVPLFKEDALIGAILLYRDEVRPFTDKQIALLKNFAAQAVIAIENTRLLNELRESLQQQTATADVLKVISSSPGTLDPVFSTMLAKATELCEASYGTLWLQEGDGYRTAAIYGDLPPTWIEQWRSGALYRPRRDVPLARAAEERQPIQVADMRADPSYLHGDPLPVSGVEIAGIRTLLVVPMFRESEFVGSIAIYRKEVLSFTEKQIELVKNFAAQAVIAIENTRLLNELRESLQQQTATADVLKVISRSTFDLQAVLDTLVESAARLCEADKGVIIRPTETGTSYYTAASYHHTPEYIEYMSTHTFTPGRGGVVGRVLLEGKSVQIPDVLADLEYTYKEAANRGGWRTILGVPLLRERTPIGVLVLHRAIVRPFSENHIELLETFADQAVIAIENVRLFEEVQARTRELSESLEQQTATAEVLKVVSSSPGELEPVFNAMLENATRICHAEFGTLYLRETDAFRAVAIHNAPSAFVEARKGKLMQPPTDSALGRLTTTRQVVQIDDIKNIESYVERDPVIVAAVELGGYRTVAAVPMLKDDELVGAILIYRQEVRPFADRQIELLKNFADQAVIAIENTRLLNELRESLQQQTATADVLKVISRSTFDLQTVLSALIESAVRLCSADQGVITREIDGTFFRAANFGHSLEFSNYIRETPVQLDRGSVAGRALVDGRIVHIPDVQADPEYTFSPGLDLGEFRTALGVPMLREGVPIGVLALSRKKVLPFTDKQIELVTTFADQAAIAIENVRLFESVEARTRELAKSLEDLRTTQDRLVQTQKLASLGQLTAGIAHEIKNPLNFVNNFSGVSSELIDELRQALAGANLDSKLRAEISEIADTLQGNLDKIVQHGKRADAIVKNMLLHSREGSGEHRVVDINALVEESLNLAWHGARAEKQGFDIALERSFDPTAGEADVFPQDVTRALLNLISNGFYAATRRKAETNGGEYAPTLAASTKNLGDRVEIRIRDNGTGIPLEVKGKIFNPFFTTKPAGEGTGLGLSISHDIIVKQHGGSIEVDTKPGEFTEITVTLPRVAALLS
jgi:GAF domain-containing protein